LEIRFQFCYFLACARQGFILGGLSWTPMVITHFLLPLFYGFGTCQNGELEGSKTRCFLSLLSPCQKGGLFFLTLSASLWKSLFSTLSLSGAWRTRSMGLPASRLLSLRKFRCVDLSIFWEISDLKSSNDFLFSSLSSEFFVSSFITGDLSVIKRSIWN
jgi:hypothetical protein